MQQSHVMSRTEELEGFQLNSIEVSIRYVVGEGEVKTLELTTEDYFDPPEEGEVIDVDSMARFAFPVEYIDVDPTEITWIELVVEDLVTNDKYSMTEKKWKAGDNNVSTIITRRLRSENCLWWHRSLLLEIAHLKSHCFVWSSDAKERMADLVKHSFFDDDDTTLFILDDVAE